MTNIARTPVGIVGCGNIFERYVNGLRQFDDLEILWCADLDVELARRRGADTAIPNVGSPEDAIAGRLGEATLVVNITPPAVHAKVTSDLLRAGKHVYTEKPLATTVEDARELLRLASELDLQVGAAPDWFLGPTGRAARAAVHSGEIGELLACSAFIAHSQVERWHPNPTVFFLPGAGPVFDLGPYYVSALVDLLGPIRTVAALERVGSPTRQVTAPDRAVDTVSVEVPTHATLVLEFASRVIGNLTMSFDAWERTMPFIEVYGSDGTLSLPMPHEADGPLRVKRHDEDGWRDLAVGDDRPYVRGIGVAEMARALREGAPVPTSGALGLHVLEVLSAVETSSTQRTFVSLSD